MSHLRQRDERGRGGGNGGPGPQQPTPPVKKHYEKSMKCAATSAQVMGAVEKNFPRFRNYSAGPLSVTFSLPPGLHVGSSIPIAVGLGPITQHMTVTAQSITSRNMTFGTTPGHLLYPANITVSAGSPRASTVDCNVDLAGRFDGLFHFLEFSFGGGAFEDAQWNYFISQVGAFCAGGQ